MKQIILATLLFVGVTTFAQEQPVGIQVTGEGIVKVVPDQVLIQVNVNKEGKSAKEVKEATDNTVDTVLKYLKKQKIDKNNVQTEYVTLGKSYQYQTKSFNFVSRQSISILLTDLSKYDEIMQGVLELGINGINSVNFISSEIDKYESEARLKAIKNAKQKAQQYATALEVKLGSPISMQDVNSSNFNGVQVYRAMEMTTVNSSQKETLAVGEMEVKANVNVNFSILNL
ncbi:hypothetical protein SAMN04488096_102354 [Mesonia phycicola]|uniref:DUF541 domain-containing protein n=1 Tax=Mesonia phycicola TaxID=579105 RepID=A0A1M6C3W9_9FLAO|nr:SIMPL domain-containing protein [Mesonia phycicola]SHI55755.1 hypothetical protein SAMN04488096_102354 [Mesonia phycicola]